MRIAIISDIHGNAIALKAVISHIQVQQVDNIVFQGDLVVKGPHPKECIEMMKEISPIVWIKGNTDLWFKEVGDDFIPNTEDEHYLYSSLVYAKEWLSLEDIELLLARPEKQSISVEGIDILCVHGSNHSISEPIGIMTSSEDIEKISNEIEEDILLCGHSHLPYFVSVNGKKIINVGAVSLSMDGEPWASYGIVDINHGAVAYSSKKVIYDIEKVVEDAKLNKFPYVKKFTDNLLGVK